MAHRWLTKWLSFWLFAVATVALSLIYALIYAPPNQQIAAQQQTTTPQPVTVRFFYTGELLGELGPCGCSGMKQGGMVQRSGWFKQLQQTYPDVIAIDGGFAAITTGRQPDLKRIIHQRMLEALHYRYCFTASTEAVPTEPTGLATPMVVGHGKPSIPWHRTETIAGGLRLLVLAIEPQLPTDQELAKVIADVAPDLVWLMTKELGSQLTRSLPGEAITIVQPVDAAEPYSPRQVRNQTLLVSAGNRGRYAGLLELKVSGKQLVEFQNRTISLEQEYPADEAVESLMENYKTQLKEERLLERQIKKISPVGFVGSETCAGCHAYEHERWQTLAHAKAFNILVKNRHDADPECVGCHTVGFAFEEGFRTAEETAYLMNVGCEACHGPGAQHAMDQKQPYGKIANEFICRTCHEKDRSPKFEFRKYRERIKHWQK